MKKIILFTLLFSVISFYSCDDFIDLQNPDEIATTFVLSNYDQAAVALNGIYDGMQTSNYYGRYFVLIPDLMGDDVKQSEDNSNRGTTEYRWERTTTGGITRVIWEDIYDVINRANVVIEAVPNLEAGQAQLDQLLGEALALRALGHFDLVRFFALPYAVGSDAVSGGNGDGGHLGVPLITQPQPATAVPARNTVKEVYDQVIDDLVRAVSLMDDTNNSSVVTMTSAAASALLSRVYLYKEDWVNAEAAASTVIGNSRFSLLSAVNYVGSWDGNVASSESIFEVFFSTADFNGSNHLGYMYSPEGYYDMLPTTDLDDLVATYSDPTNDVRTALWDTSVPVATKYKGPDNAAGTENTKVIRLSEVYLIRAEARARQSDFTGARADLDALRSNRGIAATSSSDADLLDAIAAERRIELAFEGHRLFDIARRGEDLTRNDCQLFNGNCTVTFPDSRFAAPIPQGEVDANPNMQQNEGY